VNGCEFNPRLGVPSVHIDNARAAADGMTLLYDLGHQRIGVVTGPLVSPLSRDRLRGASSVARARGNSELSVVGGDFSIESGVAAAKRLLSGVPRPTAIFCFNDEMAMGVLEYARQQRVRVPDALSVIGFDDIRFARYTVPALTTIAQPMRALGEGTVRLLLTILANDATTPKSVTLPHTLEIRGSTAPPARA
jgi:LacI family repressor for deo operon, udp, cdd, tsx, nupC, and nupG